MLNTNIQIHKVLETPTGRYLSEREFQVMSGMARGVPPATIADVLGLSVKTVSTYRARILEKLRMRSNAEVAVWAVRKGILKAEDQPSIAVPYLTRADALKLKESAEHLLHFNTGAHITVSCAALLSLIEQAHSPQLGLATTKELREEYECRMNGDHVSRADDYRTFDH